MTSFALRFLNRYLPSRLCFLALSLVAVMTMARAADEITPRLLMPSSGNVVGVPITLIVTVKNKSVKAVTLPRVSGITLNGSGTNPPDFNFFITPTRTGDITIPSFDIRADDGKIIHVDAVTFHVGS